MAQTCGNVVVHLIFSTKLCKPLIASDIRSDLFAYLGGIVRELRGSALIINGTCDHVHMLIRIRPAHSVAEIARIVKANSSGWIRKKGHKEFGWCRTTPANSNRISPSGVCAWFPAHESP